MKPVVSPPDPQSWDFSLCSQDEVTPCLYYEYSREALSTNACDEFKSHVKIFGRYQYFLNMARAFNEYPGTPWLGLKQAARKQFVHSLANPPQYGEPSNELIIDEAALPDFRERLRENYEEFPVSSSIERAGLVPLADRPAAWVAVELDWSRSNNELKADFERLLKLRPAEYRKKPPGRNNHRDLLNGLAGKRLTQFCRTKELVDPLEAAIEIWRANAKHGCPYSDGRALRASIRRARLFMEAVFKIGDARG